VKLRVTRRAATQIEKALDYIEAESPQGANSLRERIRTLFLLLEQRGSQLIYPAFGVW
jgi:plasmid stabilization system protein ParE